MKANTYVVKPFGISEVKVIALKGDPGTPTQEQVNTAVDEYMTEHPEAQIPDGSITEQKLSSDVVATLNDVDNKADKVGSYPDLIAGTADNLLSSSYQTDKTPYILRRTPYGARERGSIVGGSIVWNQLCTFTARANTNNGITYTFGDDGTITADGTAVGASYQNVGTAIQVQGHKVLLQGCPTGGSSSTYYLRDGYTAGKYDIGQGLLVVANANTIIQINVVNGVNVNNLVFKPQIFDLTLMFGTEIADYIYTQEQASAGAGVALAKAWAGIVNDYYPYDAGTIKSVEGLTAHRMTDGNSEVIGEYPLDSSLTLRGLPKLDGDSIYYDGDAYKADGTVERKYGIVDMGTLNWESNTAGGEGNIRMQIPVSGLPGMKNYSGWSYTHILCSRYPAQNVNVGPYIDKSIGQFNNRVLVYDTDYTDARAFKSAMSGVYLLYELAEPTTEQAEPYTELQACDPNGTEEWVGASMPVGHETKYYADLKGKIEDIPNAPSTNGTYVLKATVSSSGVTYAWIAG